MFDWLFEGRKLVYLLLAVAAIVLALVWYQTRRRTVLLSQAAAVVLLIGLYALLDVLVVTDREQIEHNVEALGEAAVEGNADHLFSHFSRAPDARFIGLDRAQFESLVKGLMGRYKVREALIWDVEVSDVHDGTAAVSFKIKPKVQGADYDSFFRCETTFVQEEGAWRIKILKAFQGETGEPVGGQNVPR